MLVATIYLSALYLITFWRANLGRRRYSTLVVERRTERYRRCLRGCVRYLRLFRNCPGAATFWPNYRLTEPGYDREMRLNLVGPAESMAGPRAGIPRPTGATPFGRDQVRAE